MEVFNQYIVTEKDVDLFHHMNYIVYIKWFEKERTRWFEAINYSLKQMAEEEVGVVVLKLETNYVKEVREGEAITIQTSPDKLGNSSLTMTQTMYNEQQEIVATSNCLLVMFDLQARKSIPVVANIAQHVPASKK